MRCEAVYAPEGALIPGYQCQGPAGHPGVHTHGAWQWYDTAELVTVREPVEGWPSPEAHRIAAEIVPAWLDLFLTKNREYQTGDAEQDATADTGLIGQYSDIYRKLKKLRRPLLFGDFSALVSEDATQILLDLVGHCFLTIDMLRTGAGRVWEESNASE